AGRWNDAVTKLFKLSETRGKEAAGIAMCDDKGVVIHKDALSASKMLRHKEYSAAVERGTARFFKDKQGPSLATIGHSRLVTNGVQGIDANNQPIWRDEVVLIHNGIITNVDAVWDNHAPLAPRADVDSEVLAALLSKYRSQGDDIASATQKVFDEIYGETSIATFFADLPVMLLATNTGSLYYMWSQSKGAFIFTSEEHICKQLQDGKYGVDGFAGVEIFHCPAGNGRIVDLINADISEFELNLGAPTPAYSPGLAALRLIDEKSYRLRQKRKNLRRCTKCLLPETMPYIAFDDDGVCNYCHAHTPWEKMPEDVLIKELDKYRRPGSEPDTVVAFSGGRDSSYGLHLLCERYDMTPLTFSYDWGMVTDLARRNQARMCGKLGVEHIWISADIRKKRDNIRRNVSAWLNKPDLGLIPLFMAGDKQFFWYARETIRSTGIPLSVFCTNRLEKTDFKTGFLDIPPVGVENFTKPTSLAIMDKANLFWQYGKRLASNPSYFNRSLPDTMWATFSYYGIEQEHLFMFDYLPWDENTINDTLINQYGWETAPDTPSTWRIGDGTQPWYNYIYYTVAGFTEFDTFRSNQIREGMITREEAL
ncbi:MAG: hypothetical protein AAF926_08690, partial [Pseudomonadota bacterium]